MTATVCLCLWAGGGARADLIDILPDQDATIYSDALSPPRANGAGASFFVGMTGPANPNNLRRALLSFDIDAIVPSGAVITNVTLTLRVDRAPGGGPSMVDMMLHPSLMAWTEGGSDPPGPEGAGMAASSGDVTWYHTSFSNSLWNTAGGDFGAASVTQSVGGVGFVQFSSAQMIADVQSWLDTPSTNFGWFLIGDEDTAQTSRRFVSSNDPDFGPVLSVGYVIPEPGTVSLCLLSMLVFSCFRRRR